MLEVFTEGACSGNPGPGGWAEMARGAQEIGCAQSFLFRATVFVAAVWVMVPLGVSGVLAGVGTDTFFASLVWVGRLGLVVN